LKKIISPGPIPAAWDPEALFLKAQRYAQRMAEEDSGSWEYAGHRVVCPACQSVALVNGEPISVPNQKLEDDQIVETQQHLPSNFQCIACSLKILGLSRLSAVNLGDRYTKTETYDAAEYYAPQDDYAGYDDDNNEPG
jgi:hypothetical protein